MNKPVFGMILGGVLGIFDGLTALWTPAVAPQIVGIGEEMPAHPDRLRALDVDLGGVGPLERLRRLARVAPAPAPGAHSMRSRRPTPGSSSAFQRSGSECSRSSRCLPLPVNKGSAACCRASCLPRKRSSPAITA